jgi:hypothetical protein
LSASIKFNLGQMFITAAEANQLGFINGANGGGRWFGGWHNELESTNFTPASGVLKRLATI